MTTALQSLPPAAGLLTYEAYMAEDTIYLRYDIVDGERIYMPSPTRQHQKQMRNVARPLEDYAASSGSGQVFVAPCDVLITRRPLRVRQPDVLFISNARLAQNPPSDDPAPLQPPPELVIEIVSPSDTPRVLGDKIADYCAIGVLEGWFIRRAAQSVEVQQFTSDGAVTRATYGMGETIQSLTFPDLTVSVDAIFAA